MAKIIRPERESDSKKPTRFFSKKQEDSVATTIDGHRNANSGATAWQKGDVTSSKFLIECKTKTTHSDSISIKKEWIKKNIKESLFMNKEYCAIAFSFGPNEENYYIIDEKLFADLVNYLEER